MLGQLTGTGDLGQAILAAAPPAAQAQLAPFIPEIVAAIHRAFTIATASTFSFGIVAAIIAAAAVVLLPEIRAQAPSPARANSATRPVREPAE